MIVQSYFRKGHKEQNPKSKNTMRLMPFYFFAFWLLEIIAHLESKITWCFY